MAATNYTARIEQLNSIHNYPLGISNRYGDQMVRENDEPFIGNSTLLEALFREYTKSYKEYSGNEVRVALTSEQHSALKEISRVLTDESSAILFGIEAIGYLLKKGDNEGEVFGNDQIEYLGWLLEHLAKTLNGHLNLMESVSDDLAKSTVSY